jgi:GT2 family glycosyltransferase
MAELTLSVSLVVFKPDFTALGRTLLGLQRAARLAKQNYILHPELTLVDNSCDTYWHERLQAWIKNQTQELPDWKLRLLQAPANVGYGRGNNMVIERVQSDYHLVINPDLFIEPDALLHAIDFMQSNTDAGLLTPSVFGEDGERHYLCKRNPTLFIMFLRGFAGSWLRSLFKSRLDAFEMRDCDYLSQIEGIQYPSGCFMFFRTAHLQQLHGFDPAFFMYLEDADIGRRMLKISRVVYVPAVKVVHQWARGSHRSWRLRWVTMQSAFTYWKKWGGTF